jgi:uncharacterized membrane protein (DUF4010 family)
MTELQQAFFQLGIALAMGLLIGVERGWQAREADAGERVAGVRTYGLIGLAGGIVAMLAQQLGALVLGLALLGLIAALTVIYAVNLGRDDDDVGMTSFVARLLVFLFGALAGLGEVVVAAAAAVVTLVLLSYKPLLHRWLQALEADELRAGIKLLLISVVLLPILPNQGYVPWQVLNPFEIWWMVVLIASISFVGYFALKIGGATKGAIFTGLFGGLASSTALTLYFSRRSRRDESGTNMLAVGILLACGTMFPRMVLVASLINPAMFEPLLIPALAMALPVFLSALMFLKRTHDGRQAASPLKNPLELGSALSFGLLLVLIMLLGRALQDWFGDAGLLWLAGFSGATDVDAINLSLARMSLGDLAVRMAAIGVVIAASTNNLAKACMALFVGGRANGIHVGLPLMLSSAAGVGSALWWIY